jgi:hypothetical protein
MQAGSSHRLTAIGAGGLGLLAFLTGAAAVGFIALTGFADASFAGPDVPISLTYPIVGAIVVARRPRHPIGWALLVAGVGASVESLAQAYAYAGTHGHDLPGVRLVSWLQNCAWVPGFVVLTQVLFVYYPEGRLPSRRWRPVPRFTVATLVTMVAAASLRAGPLPPPGKGDGPFPVVPAHVSDVLVGVSVLSSGVVLVAAVVSLVLRARRAHGAEVQQMRILAYAGAIALISFLSSAALSGWADAAVLVIGCSTPAIAIGIAVLRFRLFDIDRVFSRTLSYTIVTGCIVGIYVGLVALATGTLNIGSNAGAAAATLAAAAVFQPLRRRVQVVVDRRFNRARYDAERATESFAADLRSEIDVTGVSGLLLDTAARHLEPTTASLWLARSASRRRPGQRPPISRAGRPRSLRYGDAGVVRELSQSAQVSRPSRCSGAR